MPEQRLGSGADAMLCHHIETIYFFKSKTLVLYIYQVYLEARRSSAWGASAGRVQYVTQRRGSAAAAAPQRTVVEAAAKPDEDDDDDQDGSLAGVVGKIVRTVPFVGAPLADSVALP